MLSYTPHLPLHLPLLLSAPTPPACSTTLQQQPRLPLCRSHHTPAPFLPHPSRTAHAHNQPRTRISVPAPRSCSRPAHALGCHRTRPADRASTAGLRLVPVYTLTLHLPSLFLRPAAREAGTACHRCARGDRRVLSRTGISVARLVLAACALAECALPRLGGGHIRRSAADSAHVGRRGRRRGR
jgi:hypothetical protein